MGCLPPLFLVQHPYKGPGSTDHYSMDDSACQTFSGPNEQGQCILGCFPILTAMLPNQCQTFFVRWTQHSKGDHVVKCWKIFRGSYIYPPTPIESTHNVLEKNFTLDAPHLTPIYIHVKWYPSESTVAYRVPNCSIFKNQGALLATPRMISDPSAAISKSELPTWRCWRVTKWMSTRNPLRPTIYKWLAINWMIPNLYIGNGWKSPFPSIYKWLFGVPGSCEVDGSVNPTLMLQWDPSASGFFWSGFGRYLNTGYSQGIWSTRAKSVKPITSQFCLAYVPCLSIPWIWGIMFIDVFFLASKFLGFKRSTFFLLLLMSCLKNHLFEREFGISRSFRGWDEIFPIKV